MKDIKTAEKEFYNSLHELDMQKNFQSIDLIEYEKRKIELLQNYHKAKVESISDEELKKMFTTEHFSQSNGRYYRTRVERITGARMFKNKLLNDL